MLVINRVLPRIAPSLKAARNLQLQMKISSANSDKTMVDLEEILPTPPYGPLEPFRKTGSFDWRKMKIMVESEEMIRFKHKIWSFLRTHPIFEHPKDTPSFDEIRHRTTKKMYLCLGKEFFTIEAVATDPRISFSYMEAMLMYDSSLLVKMSVSFKMFSNVVLGMGGPQQYHFVEKIESGKISGCFALTEIAHGSNAKGMRTTATFQPESKDFLLHTPDFEAAKCWVGGLGQGATHAIVYAQLVSKGQSHGLHAFIVPLRCPISLKPYGGVTVGDLGEKIGLNGVDNGFVMFNNYRIPFANQLSRHGGINTNGDYVTPIKDPNRRFGASLGILSGGRVSITGIASAYLQKGVVIAIRYAAIRKQFADTIDATEETPIIKYQNVQVRILPYLASAFAMKIFSSWFSEQHMIMTFNGFSNSDDEKSKTELAEMGMELHGLSSATKPFCSWLARDGLQACRELCAGHGYLAAAGIGALRNDNDANCTYEGENSILVQQTMNWLLTLWSRRHSPDTFVSPLKSIYYLKDADRLLRQKCNVTSVEDALKPETVLNAYKWLVTYMLNSTADRLEAMKKKSGDPLKAKNDSQSYYALPTAIIYGEHFVLERFYNTVRQLEPSNERRVLLDLVSLFGVWMLEKHMGTLYMGEYWNSSKSGEYVRQAVIEISKKLSTEAILLADVLAPPDFVLNSVLGCSDGEMYKNLQNSIFTSAGALVRPNWWQDIVHWRSYVPAKL